jgi:hypothetical protein
LGSKHSGHEKPERRIDSYVKPKGCLTKPGMKTMKAAMKNFGRELSDGFAPNPIDFA